MNLLTKCKLIVKERKNHGTVPLSTQDHMTHYKIVSCQVPCVRCHMSGVFGQVVELVRGGSNI